MLRKIEFAPEEYYHLYNRGTDRRKIFLNDRDWTRFHILLYLANSADAIRLADISRGRSLREMFATEHSKTLVEIGAYCLMPNHFHLLVRERSDNGISLFMKKLLTGYSMYFNIKHHRTGALFEGRFRAEHVADDRHLQYLFAYIHLNPVKISDPKNWKRKTIPDAQKALRFLENYRYSSFPDYWGTKRPEGVIINSADFPDYFTSADDFRNFIKEWAKYDKEGN